MSNDLSNSVIMPREDFIELSTVAFDNHYVPSASERVAQTAQTTAIFAGLATCWVAASWGWVKAMEYREKKQFERRLAEVKFEKDNGVRL